ncbi:MAG: hypothetical protein HUU01_04495 [Saprospiraceae bacterium]|nr:hypothetical protein [Saprospiraceae bacterium]
MKRLKYLFLQFACFAIFSLQELSAQYLPFDITAFLATTYTIKPDQLNVASFSACGNWLLGSYRDGKGEQVFAIQFNTQHGVEGCYFLGAGKPGRISCQGHAAYNASDESGNDVGMAAIFTGDGYFIQQISVPLEFLPATIQAHENNPPLIPGTISSIIGPDPEPVNLRKPQKIPAFQPSWKAWRVWQSTKNEKVVLIGNTKDIEAASKASGTMPASMFNVLTMDAGDDWERAHRPSLVAAVRRSDRVVVLSDRQEAANLYEKNVSDENAPLVWTAFAKDLAFMDSVVQSGTYFWDSYKGEYRIYKPTHAATKPAKVFTVGITIPVYQKFPNPDPAYWAGVVGINIETARRKFREYSPQRAFVLRLVPVLNSGGEIIGLTPTDQRVANPVTPVGFLINQLLNGKSKVHYADQTGASGTADMEPVALHEFGAPRFERMKGFFTRTDQPDEKNHTLVLAHQSEACCHAGQFIGGIMEQEEGVPSKAFVLKLPANKEETKSCAHSYLPEYYYKHALPLGTLESTLYAVNKAGWACGGGDFGGPAGKSWRAWLWKWCDSGCDYEGAGSVLIDLNAIWMKTYSRSTDSLNYTLTACLGYENGSAYVLGEHNKNKTKAVFRFQPEINDDTICTFPRQ